MNLENRFNKMSLVMRPFCLLLQLYCKYRNEFIDKEEEMKKSFFKKIVFCFVLCLFFITGCSSQKELTKANTGKISTSQKEVEDDDFTGNSAQEKTVETIDLFQDIEIVYEGWDGFATAKTVDKTNCNSIIKELVTFEITGTVDNLSTGDTISVIASYDANKLNKLGYVSLNDKSMITVEDLPYIKEAHHYSDDVVWVKGNFKDDSENKNKWVCCDKEGNILFSLDENSSPYTDFSNGISIIRSEDDNYVVDKTGAIIWSAQKDGFAAGEENWGEGNIEDVKICEDYLYSYGFFGYPIVTFYIESYELTGKAYGVLDNKGEWRISPGLNLPFDSSLASGVYEGGNDELYNILTDELAKYSDDTLDKWEEDYLFSIHDGLLFCFDDYNINKNPAFCDKDGKVVIDLSKYILREKPEFIDGYAFLNIYNQQDSHYYTIIDTKGNQLFEPQQEIYHDDFSEGFYWVDGEGYRNISGEIAFGAEFSSGETFSEGMALVHTDSSSDNNYHFINTEGKIIY